MHIDNIKNFAAEIIEENDGITMLSAKTVLAGLIKRGHGKTADGRTIHAPNVIGDSLGRYGLCLPCLKRNGKLRYAVSMVNASEEEKAQAQEQLNNLTPLELKALPVA